MRVVLGLALLPLLLGASPALAADAAALYQTHCASCHGADGQADTPAGKAMKVPPFGAAGMSADEVVKAVRSNDRHKAVAGKLSDAELQAIAAVLPGPR